MADTVKERGAVLETLCPEQVKEVTGVIYARMTQMIEIHTQLLIRTSGVIGIVT